MKFTEIARQKVYIPNMFNRKKWTRTFPSPVTTDQKRKTQVVR